MSAATTTIIGLGIAGASMAGQAIAAHSAASTSRDVGKMQADAANQAGDRQTQAMQQAMALSQQNQLAMNQGYQPYIQSGTNALNSLNRGMGLPSAPSGMAGPSGMPAGGASGMPPSNFLNPAMSAGQAARRPLSGMGAPASPNGTPSTPVTGSGPGMVMLEAPTGERRSVPQDQAQALIARGARQVS